MQRCHAVGITVGGAETGPFFDKQCSRIEVLTPERDDERGHCSGPSRHGSV